MSPRFMSEHLVVVNFKTYESAHGIAAEELALIMERIETGARMIAVVSAFDLSAVVSAARPVPPRPVDTAADRPALRSAGPVWPRAFRSVPAAG